MLSGSSLDTNFTPRREFIKDQRATTNSFSFLAISGSNFIRLHSFPGSILQSLRRVFRSNDAEVSTFKEHVGRHVFEFSLEGKPWATPKNVKTEKLLVDMLGAIHQHGYVFVSTIDYGREPDDRLVIVFSKPTTSLHSSNSGSPLRDSGNAGGSQSSLPQPPPDRMVAFALSFASSTILRVINPPQYSTPAILRAVRSAWPRGVVNEKSIGHGSYEFKLKGYRWFQDDNVATDTLRHVLSILSSLDSDAFSLLFSVTLTGRSRVRDLWIFTGPEPPANDRDPYAPESPAPSNHNLGPGLEPRGVGHGYLEPPLYTQPLPGEASPHGRTSTVPGSILPQTQPRTDPSGFRNPDKRVRAAAELNSRHYSPAGVFPPRLSGNHLPQPSFSSLISSSRAGYGFLRKPAPRAQIPESVELEDPTENQETHENQAVRSEESHRITLPSTTGSTENMTGVGSAFGRGNSMKSPAGLHEPLPSQTVPEDRSSYFGSLSYVNVGSAPPNRSSMQPISPSPTRPTPRLAPFPIPPSNGPPAQDAALQVRSPRLLPIPPTTSFHPSSLHPSMIGNHRPSLSGPPHLLASGVFAADTIRDSAFSSTTDGSREVPVKWTGDLKPEATIMEDETGVEAEGDRHLPMASKQPPLPRNTSLEPNLPGGWMGESEGSRSGNVPAQLPEHVPAQHLEHASSQRLEYDPPPRVEHVSPQRPIQLAQRPIQPVQRLEPFPPQSYDQAPPQRPDQGSLHRPEHASPQRPKYATPQHPEHVPMERIIDDGISSPGYRGQEPLRSLQEVEARVEAPEVVQPPEGMRKSETGIVGVVSPHNGIHVETRQVQESPRQWNRPTSWTGQGWVLVNVGTRPRNDRRPVPPVRKPPLPSSSSPVTRPDPLRYRSEVQAADPTSRSPRPPARPVEHPAQQSPGRLKRMLGLGKADKWDPPSPTGAQNGQRLHDGRIHGKQRTEGHDRLRKDG